MNPSILFVVAILTCVILAGCSSTTNKKSRDSSIDPFAGFFAYPSSGALELAPAGQGKYRGSMYADFGPFPVELTRDGNVARGSVSFGDASQPLHSQPLQVESTPQGLVVTVNGKQADAPLQRYKDMNAYAEWFRAQGGYQGTIDPATRPSR